jgi:hypothetical protein
MTEFAKLQDSTKTFTRIGFCDRDGHAACGVTDWCYLLDKPFECADQTVKKSPYTAPP